MEETAYNSVDTDAKAKARAEIAEIREKAGLNEKLIEPYRRTWRDSVRTLISSLAIVAACFATAASLLAYSTAQDVKEGQYVGRSVLCRVLILNGGETFEGGPCMDPNVLKHYNLEETRREAQELRSSDPRLEDVFNIACQTLRNTGGDDTGCP